MQWLARILVVQGKITFLLNIKPITTGFKLSDKITQIFCVIRLKPIIVESSLIHPDRRKKLRQTQNPQRWAVTWTA